MGLPWAFDRWPLAFGRREWQHDGRNRASWVRGLTLTYRAHGGPERRISEPHACEPQPGPSRILFVS